MVLLILISSGAQTNKADPVLKSKIKFVDASNIEVSENSDGGLHFKSTGTHLKNQKVEIADIDFKAKDKIKNGIIKGWYLADGSTTPIVIDIPITKIGNKYSFDITLSETCIGCFTGTATITQLNMINGSYINLLNAVNASSVTITVSGISNNSVPTVTIGTQTWMQYNLNVGTKVTGATTMTDNGVIEKYCYDDNENICTTDGGLYQWNEIMNYSTTEGVQGIAPTGFHIPTDAEQYTLENYLKDGTNSCVSSRSGWDCDTAGTKLKVGGSSGYNGILAGSRGTSGTFGYRAADANFWSSTESGASAWGHYLYSGFSTVGRHTDDKAYGFSVRAIMNPGYDNNNNTITVQPVGHPQTQVTTNASIISFSLNLTAGVPFQNTQFFLPSGSNVTMTVKFTANTTTEFEGSSNGWYNYNTTLALNENITNGSINLTIQDATFLNSQYKGTASFSTNNSNATLSVNIPYLNTSLGVTNTSNKYYNVSIPYNNASTSTLDNQSFLDNQNNTILSSVSDVNGDTIYCYGTLDGVTLTSCTSNDFGIKSVGTYVYSLNITDRNGTVGGAYPWVNKTATINITTGVYPVTNLSVATGNFYHNWTWSNPTNASYDNTSVYINGTFVQNKTIPFYNLTANPHNTSTISLRTVNVTNGVYSTWNNLTSVIPNNPITISGVSSSYSIIEGDSLSIDANYTDADSDTGVFATNATKGSLNSGTGVWSLNSVIGDAGTYQWNVSVSDGYGSTSTANYTLTIESTSSGITREVKIHPSQINLSAVPGDAYGYLCVYTNRTPYINLTGCSKP